MRKLFLPLIFLIILGACAQKPTKYQMGQANYGEVPKNYVSLITHKLEDMHTGSQPIKVEVPRPYAAVRYLGMKHGGKYEYGNVVHAWVVTQDAQGHYTRKSPKIFWWSDTGWSTMLPSLEGITPKYPEQAEEYTGLHYTRY